MGEDERKKEEREKRFAPTWAASGPQEEPMDFDNTRTVVAGQDGVISADIRNDFYRPAHEVTPPREEEEEREHRSPSPRIRQRRFRDQNSEERFEKEEREKEKEKERKKRAAANDDRELRREEEKLKNRGLKGVELRREMLEVNDRIVKRRLRLERERFDKE